MEEQFDFHAIKGADNWECRPISNAAKDLCRKVFSAYRDGLAIELDYAYPFEQAFRKGTALGDSGLTYKIID